MLAPSVLNIRGPKLLTYVNTCTSKFVSTNCMLLLPVPPDPLKINASGSVAHHTNIYCIRNNTQTFTIGIMAPSLTP